MRKNASTYRIIASAVLVAATLVTSCKEDTGTSPAETAFTLQASDSIVFEHADTLNIQASSTCAIDKEFAFTLSNLSTIFTPEQSSIISRSNLKANFGIRFKNIQSYTAGTFPCVVTGNVTNENSTPQSKTVKVIYRPNCAYNYRKHVNGTITYTINGILLNRSITCSYTDEGYLKIENLSNAGSFELKFDCSNNNATIVPKTVNGHYLSGTAQITGNNIAIQMYSDGNLNATMEVKP
jgi:hypothetical protein